MEAKAEPRAEDAVRPPPLQISRTVHAPREVVFRAWSSAEHVKAWFSPETYTVSDARVELRVGGPFEVCMRAPDGQAHWTRGVFVEVTPPSRLVFDAEIHGADGKPLFRAYTEVDFSDALGGTRLDVTQTYTVFAPALADGMVGGASEGWRTTLDKLEREALRMTGAAEAKGHSVVHATFHLERTYAAPAERVWRALTDPVAKARWFSGPPGGWTLIERTMDVRPGGRERLVGRWEGGVESAFDAIYYDVVQNRRLVYAYEMHMGARRLSVSLATLQIEAKGADSTRLEVTEQGAFLDGYDDAGARETGTGFLLDALGASLMD
jgi:uncharacterized protein YndB with AHSA1/START domain